VVEGEHDEELWVRAVALSPDGTLAVRMSATGDPADAAGVGGRLASDMLAEGAAQLTDTQPSTPHEQPVTDCERQEA
jgi:hydroxymethylbilane synthase